MTPTQPRPTPQNKGRRPDNDEVREGGAPATEEDIGTEGAGTESRDTAGNPEREKSDRNKR